MERKKVDARGLSCPQPVMETKKVLDTLDRGMVVVIVDNATARDNIARLARSKGCAISIEEREGDYYLMITKG